MNKPIEDTSLAEPLPPEERASLVVRLVETSADIITSNDAISYYRRRLARRHDIVVRDRPVSIVFEHDGTHLFSTGPKDGECEDDIPAAELITRTIRRGKNQQVEKRRFSQDRARLMHEVLRAVTLYTKATGHQKDRVLLYGPRLADGRFMKVVLRPSGRRSFTCVSAHPIDVGQWQTAQRDKPVPFPPEEDDKKVGPPRS